jgi:hypothetical protein
VKEDLMSKELKKMEGKHCYACLQWDGPRTFDPEKKMLLVDENLEENCLIFHKKVKGSSTCDRFFPFR